MAHIESHERGQFLDPRKALLGIAYSVNYERLAENLVRAHARIERTDRILEHELDFAPVRK